MYRWWTFSAGREPLSSSGRGTHSWLKLGPITFAWGAWFGPRVSFEVHAFNRLIFHRWSTT